MLRTLLGVAGLVVLVAIVGAVAVFHAVRLEHRLQTLSTSLQVAQNEVENGQLGQARSRLDAVEANLSSINSSLYNSPDFTVMNLLPVAHQNIQAYRSAVTLALQLVGGGQQIFNAAAPLEGPTGHLDVSLKDGQAPTPEIKAVEATLPPVIASLPNSAVPPAGRFVLGPVRHAEQRVWSEAFRRRNELSSVDNGLNLLDEFTGGNGNRRYLIAVANTAEMRGAGGMILSYGVLDSAGGKVTLGPFGPIADLTLSHPAPVSFPPDFASAYRFFEPNMVWQDATMMSDFTVDAPVLESMYTEATGLPVNGVIQTDPAGLAAILTGTGPLQDPELGTVDAANVVPLTLNQAYVQFPNRPVRQEYLTGVAREAFSALTSGNLLSLRPLGTALVRAAQDRHVVLASTDPATEATIKALGFDGSLPPPTTAFTQLTVQNVGGNKLDYYLQSSLKLTGTWPVGAGAGHAQATVTLTNTAPANGTSQYIFGEAPNKGPPGTYHGLVTLYLPEHASLSGSAVDTTASQPQVGTQNQVTAVTYTVIIPPGGQSRIVLDLDLPARPKGAANVVVVPTPRLIPTVTTVDVSG